MKRGEFILQLGAFCSWSALVSTLDQCSQDSINPRPPVNFTIDLSDPKFIDLATVGGVVFYEGVFIVRAAAGYNAISQVCTHAECNVTFLKSANQSNCPCHGGKFDLEGRVISGPPPSALAQYKVAVNGTMLTVSS